MAASLGTVQQTWVKEAERSGWTYKVTADGHLQFLPPSTAENQQPITMPGRKFEKANRGLKNARAQLRRRGLDV